MLNILVIDTQECSCFFIKSILLGRHYRVSISSMLRDARDKINTGLFDVIVMDLSRAEQEEKDFVKEVNDSMPCIPVIGIIEQGENFDAELKLSETLNKPIRVRPVIEAVYRAASALGEHKQNVVADDAGIIVDIESQNGVLKCVAKRISTHGMLIEHVHTTEMENDVDFQNFFVNSRGEELKTVLSRGTDNETNILGKVAFTEKAPSGGRIKEIGIHVITPELLAACQTAKQH